MKPKRLRNGVISLILVSVLMVPVWSISAQAFTLGKTYDKSNVAKIKTLAPQFLYNWVNKGDLILKTAKLNFDFAMSKHYIALSAKNAGKYSVGKDGMIVDRATGKVPKYIVGNPFPGTIDPKDPEAAEKIMYNFKYLSYRSGAFAALGDIEWIGKSLERQVAAKSVLLPYQNNPQGKIPNPNNILNQTIVYVVSPMDLRGTVQMDWEYADNRPDTAFAYLPMLRRVNQVSPATRSDPFLGSDFCTDDVYLWGGKNQSMKWKLLGSRTVLVPFSSPDAASVQQLPNGAITRTYFNTKVGYQVPGWKGAPWAPTNIIWTPRDVWMVQAIPKDPYYAYGKMIYYIDKESYFPYYKEIFDHSGGYWKTDVMYCTFDVAQTGANLVPQADAYFAVDDRTGHATFAIIRKGDTSGLVRVPYSEVGPQNFTLSAVQALSK